MNVQEFRVGNYIKDTFDIKNIKIRKLDLEDFSVMLNFQNSNNHAIPYNPIQLTEELLLKCKFEYDKSDQIYSITTEDNIIIIEFDKEDNEFYCQCGDLGYSYFMITIKYLHQLQNLYFALTGQELEINL